MYILSKDDFLANANIGKFVNFLMKDGTSKQGTLLAISNDCATIKEDSSHMDESFLLDCIEKVEIGRLEGASYSREELKRFRNKCNSHTEHPKLTFAYCFKALLEQFVKSCPDSFLAEYVRTELEHRAGTLTNETINDYLERLEKCESVPGCSLVRTMLLSLHREFAKAASLIYADNNDEMDIKLLRVCFFAQMKDKRGTYFWLEQYLLSQEDGKFCENPMWQYYLRGSVQFATYECINELLEKVARTDIHKAIESMSYLLALNNSTLAALNMLGRSNEKMTTADANELLAFGCSLLTSDPDGHFHRYRRCVNEIITNGQVTMYDEKEKIEGYVYEYIPEQNYGFIVGNDLLCSYFHDNSINENSRAYTKIKENLCSLRTSEQEDLVQLSFERSSDSKRTYAALHIGLKMEDIDDAKPRKNS